MPSLHTKPGSPFWIARWQRAGKDLWRSTGVRCRTEQGKLINRKAARAVMKRLVTEDKRGADMEYQVERLLASLEQLPEDKQPTTRQELAARILAGQKQKLAIGDTWQAWLGALKKRDPAAKTKLGYEAIWRRFERWVVPQSVEFLHQITAEQAQQYSEDLWASQVSESTFNAHVKFLRAAFKRLRHKAGLAINVWQDIEMKERRKDEETGRRNLSEEELKTVLGRAQGSMKLMLCVGLFTGLRLGDVAGLRWDEIDHDRYSRTQGPAPGFIVVRPMKTARLGKSVRIPIHASLRAMLDEHRRSAVESEFVFPTEHAAYSENPGNVTKPIKRFLESCGLNTTVESANGHRRRAIVRVGFHSLRHSFVSLCAKAGTPMHVVQKLVGHGNPMLTADVYTHVDSEQRREAIDTLPDLGFRASVANKDKSASSPTAS